MNIQQFQYVLAVAEWRHFEQAAEKCFVTQSTLSTMISKFEDEIGIRIFDRRRKPVLITREGEAIISHLKNILYHVDHLKLAVKEMKGEIEGSLKIAIIPTVSPFLLPLFLRDFATRYPGLQIEVTEQTTEAIISLIRNRSIDIGILSIPLHHADLEETLLYDEPFLFFDATPGNTGKPVSRKETFENLWLLEEGHCMRTQVLKLCELNKKAMNSSLNIHYKAGSIDSLVRIVRASRGSTFIPYLASLDLPADHQKSIRPFEEPVPFRSIGLVSHPYFVKKKLIGLLKAEILEKVLPLLPPPSRKVKRLNPV